MEAIQFKKLATLTVIIALLIGSFLVIRPILMSILVGFLLAFIFSPIYNFIYRISKSPNFSATTICFLLIVIILLPMWFLTPLVINQSFKLYLSAQQVDYVEVLHKTFPSIFASDQFASEFGRLIQTFVIKGGNSILDALSGLILNFPTLLLQAIVILFTLYFGLKDKRELMDYIKSLSPFTKEIDDKIFKSSKELTASMLYGQVIVGILQGVVLAIGLFLFGVPNALVLSLLGVIFGILPIVGPMFVWVPVLIYLLVSGSSTVAILGLLFFGLLSSNVDNFVRPLFISKRTHLHSAIVLIGMIGGLFLFGVLGLILGPLILAYLLIILDVYRNKKDADSDASPLIKGE